MRKTELLHRAPPYGNIAATTSRTPFGAQPEDVRCRVSLAESYDTASLNQPIDRSTAQANNAFGIADDLNLVTVEPSAGGTILTWDEHYDAADPPMMRAEYDSAFADIAKRLIARFRGHVISRTVDGSR